MFAAKQIQKCGAAALGLAFLGFAAAPTLATAPDDKKTRSYTTKENAKKSGGYCMRCDKFIGTTVKSREGKDLGEIYDVVIDANDGKIAYAVLSFGGFMGFGDKLFAIPFSALDLVRDGTLVLNIDKSQLKASDGFDQDKWPNFANEKWARDTHKRYDRDPYWYTDKDRKAPRVGSDVIRVTDLIGSDIQGADNETVGTVDGLVFDCDKSRVALATVSFGGFAGFGEDRMEIPFNKLNIKPTTDDIRVTTALTATQVKNGPTEDTTKDRNMWTDGDRDYVVRVYKFYDVTPYWVVVDTDERNARERANEREG